MNLGAYLKDNGWRGSVRADGVASKVLRNQRTDLEIRELKTGARPNDGRLSVVESIEARGGKPGEQLYASPGLTVRRGAGRAGAQYRLHLARVGARTRTGATRTVIGVDGDVQVSLDGVGLVAVGSMASGLAPAPTLPSAAVLRGRPVGVTASLGGAMLLFDDASQSVQPNAPLDLSGTVYRLGSTGLLMSFDSVMFTSDGSSTEVSLRGGRLLDSAA